MYPSPFPHTHTHTPTTTKLMPLTPSSWQGLLPSPGGPISHSSVLDAWILLTQGGHFQELAVRNKKGPQQIPTTKPHNNQFWLGPCRQCRGKPWLLPMAGSASICFPSAPAGPACAQALAHASGMQCQYWLPSFPACLCRLPLKPILCWHPASRQLIATSATSQYGAGALASAV